MKSSFYVDLKATTLHPEGAALIGRLGIEVIRFALGEDFEQIGGVGGLTLGADPIATTLSLAARDAGQFWPAFIVRKEPKAHGTSRYIEGTENLLPGADVVVVEDVVTTGGSGLQAVQRLRDAGYRPKVLFTVVDREEGGRKAIEADGLTLVTLLTLKEVRELSSESEESGG